MMFNPNFRYTHRIVGSLARISAAREVILASPLVPKWELALRREALIHSAHSSTEIEGNQLTLEQVSDLAQGREVMARRKDKQEVLNYLKALEDLERLTPGGKLREEDVLTLHRWVAQKTLEHPRDVGRYRRVYVVVGNSRTREVSFRPPQNEEVPGLVQDLVAWINSPGAKELDAVLEAGIAHYELVRIHPFVDGNGRAARVLATWILFQRGFDAKRFFCLDDYYDSDRPAYYRALRSVDSGTRDLTSWLEYFVSGVETSLGAVKERVVRLSSERLRRVEKGQVALSERQMQIIMFINEHRKITNKDLRKLFNISAQAAHTEVKKLLGLGVVRVVGKGRGLYYELDD